MIKKTNKINIRHMHLLIDFIDFLLEFTQILGLAFIRCQFDRKVYFWNFTLFDILQTFQRKINVKWFIQ